MRSSGIRKQFLTKDTALLGTALLLLGSAGLVNQNTKKPQMEISKQDTALNVNKNLLVFLSAGNKRLFSDLIWIQTLMESDLEHYKNKDLNNWLYLRFMSIQALDPNFYENYLYGGQFLAIIKDDLEGANILYSKGVEKFPEDYKLNFQAGFMNYFEKGDFPTALKYLSKIENHPKSPAFIKSIINKVRYGVSNDLEATFKLVQFNYESTEEPQLKARLGQDLYVIRAELDLNCLNGGKDGCNFKDLDGVLYIKKADGYHAAKQILKYGIKLRKGIKTPSYKKSNLDK
jgi:hypothetical protein